MSIKLFIAGFVFCTTHISWAQTDPCSSFADLAGKDEKYFVGYSTGNTQANADQAALGDLARSIRQKVTATTTVTETNSDSTLNSSTKSAVSEILVGVKVKRRCPLGKDNYSAVVVLDKNLFLKSLDKKLNGVIKRAKLLEKSIANATSDDVAAQKIEDGKAFLAKYQSSVDDDLSLCKTYGGCDKIELGTSFQDLADIIAKEGDKDQYQLIINESKNNVADQLKEELITLLADENIKAVDPANLDTSSDTAETTMTPAPKKPNPRKVHASCTTRIGPSIPGVDDRVVYLNCSLKVFSGKVQKTIFNYTCNGMGNSRADAISICSNRLEKIGTKVKKD